MLFKKDELRLLWPFYLHSLIHGLSVMILPFLIIYFLDLGFSFFQVYMITTAQSIATIIFEIPTGAFADGYSRKYSTIWGFTIVAVAATGFGVFTNFYLLIGLWALVGFGQTFITGAYEAWVVDNLRYYKRDNLQQNYFIKSQSIIALGVIIAPLIGAMIAKAHSIQILWFVFAIGMMLGALLLAIFTEEHYSHKKVSVKKAILENFENSKEGIKFTLKNKSILLLTVAGMFLALMAAPSDGWQPTLVNLGLEKHALGIVFSIFGAVMVIAPFLSKLFNNMKYKNAFLINILAVIILHLSLLFIVPPMFIPAVFIFVMSGGFSTIISPLTQVYIHKIIPKKIRATVISVRTMSRQLILAGGGLIAALFMDKFGAQVVISLCSLFGIFAIFIIRKIKE